MSMLARIATITAVGLATTLPAQSSRPSVRQDPQQEPAPQAPADPIKRRIAKVDRKASRSARAFRGLEVAPEDVRRNVERMTKRLHWYSSLKPALRAGRNQGKPVVWVQALGDLTGYL